MTETPVFFNNGSTRLFGVIHYPEHISSEKAFVFCHPFAEEKLWTHRVYVSFARFLVSHGWAVLRFDYAGYGDSDGEFEFTTVEGHLSDISCAVAEIQRVIPPLQTIGLLGLRFGATLASLWASKNSLKGPLVLWEPLIDGDRFIQEALRSNLTTQLATLGEVKVTREQLVEEMRSGHVVNIDGYELSYDLYSQIGGIDLYQQSPSVENILVVKISRNKRPGKSVSTFVEQTGADLAFAVEDAFWREIKVFYDKADSLTEVTADWLEKHNLLDKEIHL